MAKRKQPEPIDDDSTLYDINVCAPESVSIPDKMAKERAIAAWWERVRIYAEAMHDLGRVVMLCRVEDPDSWYFASVPESLSPHPKEAK